MNATDDKVGALVVRIFLVVVIGAAFALLLFGTVGCTVIRGDDSYSVMQLAPGDDVQSRTSTVVGIEAMPTGIDGPTLRLGYIRSQQSRVPGYDKETQMPYVKIVTTVDATGHVVSETLEVNDEAPPAAKGWFGGK